MANGVAITKTKPAVKKTAVARRKTARKALTVGQLYVEEYWRAYKDEYEKRGMTRADYDAQVAETDAWRLQQRRIRNGEEKLVLTPEEQRDHDEFWGEMEAGGLSKAEYDKIISEVRRDLHKKYGELKERRKWRNIGITAKYLRRMKREGRIIGDLPAFAHKDMSDEEMEAAHKKSQDDDGWTEVVERARREGRLVEFEYPKVKIPRE